MSDKSSNRELRMEMLRMRASVERAEVAASLRDLRDSTGRLRNFASIAGSVSAAVAGRSGWMGLLASSVTGRPWLAALALGTVRALKRKPLLAAVAIGAVAAAVRLTKTSAKSQTPGA
jgi:hypothetical protein